MQDEIVLAIEIMQRKPTFNRPNWLEWNDATEAEVQAFEKYEFVTHKVTSGKSDKGNWWISIIKK